MRGKCDVSGGAFRSSSLRLLGPAGELVAGAQGVRVLRAEDSLAGGQQRGELVPCPGRIPRPPGESGELVAGAQGVRVLRAEDSLAGGQQRGELVPCPGRIPRIPGERGQLVAGAERIGVFSTVGLGVFMRVGDPPEELRAAAALPLAPRYLAMAHMPPLVRSRTALACGSSAAQAGQVPGSAVSGGTAAWIAMPAASCHQPAASAAARSLVIAWTSRCTSTIPSGAWVISE
jgi:hypothetical protein